VLHRHLEHALNVAVLDQGLDIVRRVNSRGSSGLSGQLRAGLTAVFQVDPVIAPVDLVIPEMAVTRRVGNHGLTVSINPVADSNVVAVLSVALYLRQRLSDIVIVELITDLVDVGLAIPKDLPPEDVVALKCDLPTVRAGGPHAHLIVVVVYPVVVADLVGFPGHRLSFRLWLVVTSLADVVVVVKRAAPGLEPGMYAVAAGVVRQSSSSSSSSSSVGSVSDHSPSLTRSDSKSER